MTQSSGGFLFFRAMIVLTFLLAPVEYAKGEERVLCFWHPYTQAQRTDEMKRSAAEFEKANPHVKVKIEIVPWANVRERWVAAHAAGALPDVGIGNPPDYLEMWQANAIYPVDDDRDTRWRQAIHPGILDRHVRLL